MDNSEGKGEKKQV